mgnify:CR=1 FL=1|tara:strand:- start:256 stop:1203 length:948 start_codon:yes stop_codon:yes gene_type:complete
MDFNKILSSILICPVSFNKTSGKEENCPTKITKNKIYFTGNNYNIIKGVPDLRMPEDRKYTSYDTILTDWSIPNPEIDKNLLKKNIDAAGLNESDIRDKIILLAGIGSGTDINFFLKLKPKFIVALDFSNYLILLSKIKYYKNKPVFFIMGDLCNIPFKTETFDYVFSGGVIHHTRTPELAHRNLWRVIKTKGFLNYSHIYLENLHNRRVTLDRLFYNLHNKNINYAKFFLRIYSLIYFILIKARILKLINRQSWRFPFLIELNGNANAREYYTAAIDYYLPRYRHMIKEEDVFDWFVKCGGIAKRTPKGFISQK